MGKITSALVLLLVSYFTSFAQTGITIGPPRVYFTIAPGQSQTERVTITNPSADYTLELGVSLEDWQYSEYGDNIIVPSGTLATSAAAWVATPETFFSLLPGESKELNIQMSIPSDAQLDSVPVHTTMLFVTQLNPRDGVDESGANIRVSVRTGIKLYQRMPGPERPLIEITNFRYVKNESDNQLALHFDNISNVWSDGTISLELLNQENGEKIPLPALLFYTMPDDKRIQLINLPTNLPSGSYIATAMVDYGDKQALKIAELEFTHENIETDQ